MKENAYHYREYQPPLERNYIELGLFFNMTRIHKVIEDFKDLGKRLDCFIDDVFVDYDFRKGDPQPYDTVIAKLRLHHGVNKRINEYAKQISLHPPLIYFVWHRTKEDKKVWTVARYGCLPCDWEKNIKMLTGYSIETCGDEYGGEHETVCNCLSYTLLYKALNFDMKTGTLTLGSKKYYHRK